MGLLKLKPHEKAKLKRVVKNDPHGDTKLLQVNPREASVVVPLLRQMGGADVVNPKTGARQFYPAGAMGGGSNPGGDRNGPAGRSGNGIGGGGHGGDGNNRDRLGADPSANSPAHYSGGPLASRGGPAMGTTVGGMGTNTLGFGNTPRSSLSISNMNQVSKAYRGYSGSFDSFGTKIGKFLGGLIGLHNMDPTTTAGSIPNASAPNLTGRPQVGFDPVGAALSALGFVGGPVGMVAAKAASIANNALGNPATINTGMSSPFGDSNGSLASSGSPSSPSSPSSSNHSGGNQGSVQTTPFGTPAYGQINQPAQTPQVQALLKLLTQPGVSFGANAPGLPDYSFYRAPYTYPSY